MKLVDVLESKRFYRCKYPTRELMLQGDYIVKINSVGEVTKVALSVEDILADDWQKAPSTNQQLFFSFSKAMELVVKGFWVSRPGLLDKDSVSFIKKSESDGLVEVKDGEEIPYHPSARDIKAENWFIYNGQGLKCSENMSKFKVTEGKLSFSEALEYAKQKLPIYRKVWSDTLFKFLYIDNGRLLVTTKNGPRSYVLLDEDLLADDWVVIPF